MSRKHSVSRRESPSKITSRIMYNTYKLSTSPFIILAYFLTYFLTQWCRILREKLTGFQLVKKFSAFYGTRKFNTAFKSARP
jgi:hypothetical protein